MAPSHSLIRSIVVALAGVLLEALLFLPGSPAGSYLEATFGVSTVILIQGLVGLLGLVLLVYSIYAITVAVIRWRRIFDAEVVGRNRFLLGETVRFKAWFKGELRHGLFTCDVCLADGSQAWWPAYDTFRRSENGDLGVLSGRKVHEAEWCVPITKGYPIGQYTVKIGVWDRVDLGSKNTPVKEKQASFWVLPPGYQGSPGTSVVVSSGDTGFVIEQRTEAGQDAHPDLLTLVYAPLYSAVLEMKGGKGALPRGYTVGTPNNPWSYNPKIIDQVVEVFDRYLALIENTEVRKGWNENKDNLRKRKFWYGDDQRKWLESIEREYHRIDKERCSV